MIAILGAMKEEIQEFLHHCDNIIEKSWQGFPFYEGRMGKNDLVIAKTGVGKALSAMFTQKMIDLYHPEVILFTGLAGALNHSYKIGDVVLAKDCIQHDMDATPFGFKRGEIPYTPYRIIESSNNLLNKAQGYISKDNTVTINTGRILTGDQFINHIKIKEMPYLRDDLAGDAIEMEGASVGLVAHINEIPFLLIRIISDKADEKSHINFNKFLKKASKESYQIIKYILAQL